jgi:hypothetical protein
MSVLSLTDATTLLAGGKGVVGGVVGGGDWVDGVGAGKGAAAAATDFNTAGTGAPTGAAALGAPTSAARTAFVVLRPPTPSIVSNTRLGKRAGDGGRVDWFALKVGSDGVLDHDRLVVRVCREADDGDTILDLQPRKAWYGRTQSVPPMLLRW